MVEFQPSKLAVASSSLVYCSKRCRYYLMQCMKSSRGVILSQETLPK